MGVGGWWGIIPALMLGLVIVLVVAALLAGAGRGASSPALTPSADPPSGLRELVEMHDRGALTDEEFAAAKRKAARPLTRVAPSPRRTSEPSFG